MRIDQTNYESFLMSYIDRELTETEIREVEEFCAANPEAARELGLLQQTVMIPTLTVFDNKASLYRGEEKGHVIGWYFRRAAIVIVLLAGSGFLYLALKPGPRLKNDNEKTVAVKAPEPEKATGRPDSITALITGPASVAVVKKAVETQEAVTSAAEPARKDAEEKVRGTARVSDGKSPIAANREKVIKRSVQTGNQSIKTTNTSIAGNRNSDPAGINSTPEEEDLYPVVTARTNQQDIAAVRMPANLTGKAISIPVNKNAGEMIAVRSGRTMPRNQVAVNDGPADADMSGAAGDDAVSVLHMAKSSSMVGKLFHRLTAGKNNNEEPENGGDKKVNISVFQFAVGK